MTINVIAQTFQSHQLIQLANEAARFLEATPKHILPIASQFMGSGVYALYYNGADKDYAGIGNVPIYVGKAVPTGARTGSMVRKEEPKLKSRLNEHARSIQQASNLKIADFKCQFMIIPVDMSAIIPVVESMLINKYRPIWNTQIDGFGNHDPGKGRYEQARSAWDRKHPGRKWADKLQS
ncbi:MULTISPECIES: Eco29kI family restriction endonuclease [Pseudoalteromonas]|nr:MULTISPECIES: Eco29kI family restriction endonuclease [Pseudoalteromonas]MCG7571601.1 Eco29kI family restriction endonuclease [Pseudoalteromonas sp. CNC9-20]